MAIFSTSVVGFLVLVVMLYRVMGEILLEIGW